MFYPTLNPENESRDLIDVFGGYNHNLRIGDNEFYDMKNMSSLYYPLISSRRARGKIPINYLPSTGEICGMIYRSDFYSAVYRSGSGGYPLTIYKNGHDIAGFGREEGVISSAVPRKFLMMGAYLIILPDKVYVNTADTNDKGSIEAEITTDSELMVQLCLSDGTPITFDYIGLEPPKYPIDGGVWLDISGENAVYKKYYAVQSSWQPVIANSVLITGEGVDTSGFKEKDGVKIQGFTNEKLKELNNTSIIYKVLDNGFVLSTILNLNQIETDLEMKEYPHKSYTVNISDDTSVVVVYCDQAKENYPANHFRNVSFTNAYLQSNVLLCTSSAAAEDNTDQETRDKYPSTVTLNLKGKVSFGKKDNSLYSMTNYNKINKFIVNDPITFSRKMPKMDFAIESNNRLWGCRYGENNDGDFVNEIYASKLGDFKNWNSYENLASDSYAASCGTDGEWTGAISFFSKPVFFKENYIHTVYGAFPSQYQINSVTARGVQKGSADSLAILNETLYYLSSEGVCTYNGSLPVNISYAFGDIRYKKGVACAYNGKYYIKAESNNAPVLMVYDEKRGIWSKEDELNAIFLCPTDDNVYYLCENGENGSLFGDDGENIKSIDWFLETGEYGLSLIDHKYISKINLRLALGKEAKAIVSIQYDNSGRWKRLCNLTRKNINPFTLPIKPKRCDRFRLRLEGNGSVKIYSISKTLTQGSDKT